MNSIVKLVTGIVVIVIIIAIGSILYFFNLDNGEKTNVANVAHLTKTQATQVNNIIIETAQMFEESLGQKEKNFETISSFLADNVDYYLEATSCCGNETRDQVLKRLQRIKDSGKFDFSPDNDIVKKIQKFNPDKVGVSEDDTIIMYSQNDEGEINYIRISEVILHAIE